MAVTFAKNVPENFVVCIMLFPFTLLLEAEIYIQIIRQLYII